jgi:type IV secretory pathway TraG/TraD family ATPase VirD4
MMKMTRKLKNSSQVQQLESDETIVRTSGATNIESGMMKILRKYLVEERK